jgi:hypothetical protein
MTDVFRYGSLSFVSYQFITGDVVCCHEGCDNLSRLCRTSTLDTVHDSLNINMLQEAVLDICLACGYYHTRHLRLRA